MDTPRARVEAASAAMGAALDALVAVELAGLPQEALTCLVRTIARTEARLAGLTARAVAAAQTAGAVEAAGSPSPVTWLADATGSTTHSASRAVSLSRAIDAAPAIADGLTEGSLATDKATALARALDRGVLDAGTVDRLVEDAHDLPAGVFAREVRAREAAADNALLRRDEQRARERRSVTTRRVDDGSVVGTFRLAPLAGDTFLTALRALSTFDPADTPDEQRRTRAQRDADALDAIARHALDAGAGGTERSTRPHISVIVPPEALAADGDTAVAVGAIGTTEHGTPVSVETIRELLCDAAIRRLVVDPVGRPLDVGRATRTWSGAQRVASAAVDGGCRGPSCDRPFAWTYLHHIDWWSNGGHTDLDRGIPLCGHCHGLVHDAGWKVELDAATRVATWTSPTGRTSRTHPRGPAAPSRLTPAAPRGRTLIPRTLAPGTASLGDASGGMVETVERAGNGVLPPMSRRHDGASMSAAPPTRRDEGRDPRGSPPGTRPSSDGRASSGEPRLFVPP